MEGQIYTDSEAHDQPLSSKTQPIIPDLSAVAESVQSSIAALLATESQSVQSSLDVGPSSHSPSEDTSLAANHAHSLHGTDLEHQNIPAEQQQTFITDQQESLYTDQLDPVLRVDGTQQSRATLEQQEEQPAHDQPLSANTQPIIPDLSVIAESVQSSIAALLATESQSVQSSLDVGPSFHSPSEDTSLAANHAHSLHGTDLEHQNISTEQQQILNIDQQQTLYTDQLDQMATDQLDQTLIVNVTQFTHSTPEPQEENSIISETMPSRSDPSMLTKQDEHVLRINGFHPIGILCERLDLILQRDKKALEREKLRRDRERRAEAAEQRRKERRDESEESRERRRERKRQKRDERPRSPIDKVRSDAIAPQKRNFNRIVQCCYCELIVRPERFGGRESFYCSAECISRRVDLVRKCVKESERILLIDMKSNIYNGTANPTIETLEAFINQNPSYNPIIDDARLAAATQRVVDPGQQKKIDLMRMDVRKAIENGLQRRCKAANMCFSMKRYKDLGLDIERALFTIHQDVNVKYRKWFKGFMTVVNDENNAYFKEVVRDKVSVKRLVMLGEEQMRTAMPVPAVLAAADSTSADNANASSAPSSSSFFARQIFDNKKSAVHAKSAVDEILGERQSDTTLLHTTHLFDANCQICKEEQAKKLAMRKRAEERESKLDEQFKLQQQKQSTPHFPNLDPTIRTDTLDPSIISALSSSGAPVLLPSRHHRTTTSDFDPPLSSAAGGDITPLMDSATGANVNNNGVNNYDPEHDPLGLNNVQVGDPLIGEDDGVQQQRHPETNIDEVDDDTFRFDGGAFDDNDYGEEEETTTDFNIVEKNAGKENVSNNTPIRSDGLQPSPARQQCFDTPPPALAFSNDGIAGADENGRCSVRSRCATGDSTDHHFKRVRRPRTPPPPQNYDFDGANIRTTQSTDATAEAHGDTTADYRRRDIGDSADGHFQRGPRTPTLCFATPTAGSIPNENIAGNVLHRPTDSIEEAHEMPQQFFNETEPSADPWKTESLLVWHGLFVSSKQSFFNCTCTAVSGGRAVFKAGREMMPPYSVPATRPIASNDVGRIHLIGLSDSRGVWEYVMQLRDSWNKQVCLLVVNRPEEKPDFVNYMECFAFYNQGTQVGVLDFADHPTIKDGYVFTLSPGEPLPSVLLPLDGVGLPEWTQHNGCIMLMVVRRMDPEDKQWKRHRMGMGAGDETWRRQQQQQQPQITPMDIPVASLGRGSGVERMARVLSDPSCHRLRLDDIDFAANVEPTSATIDRGVCGPIPFGGKVQMFDFCGSTPRQLRHSPHLVQSRSSMFPSLFSEISPIGIPSTSSRFNQQHQLVEQHRYQQHHSGETYSSDAGTSNFGTPPATTPPNFHRTPSSIMMQRPVAANRFNSTATDFSLIATNSPVGNHSPLPSVLLMPSSAERTPQHHPQQNFADEELPVANTVDEVIEAIQRIDNPRKVVLFVAEFAGRQGSKLGQAELIRIQFAIREAAAGRRQTHSQQQQQQSPQPQQQNKQRERSPQLQRPVIIQEKAPVSDTQDKMSPLLASAASVSEKSSNIIQRPYSPSEWESLKPDEAEPTTSATVIVVVTTTTTTASCSVSSQQQPSFTTTSELPPKNSSAISLIMPPLPQSPIRSAKPVNEMSSLPQQRAAVQPQLPTTESAQLVDKLISPLTETAGLIKELPPPPPPNESAGPVNEVPPPPPMSQMLCPVNELPPPPPPNESFETVNELPLHRLSEESGPGSVHELPPPPPPSESIELVSELPPPPPLPLESVEPVNELPPPPPPPPIPAPLPLSVRSTDNSVSFLHSPPPLPPPPPRPRPPLPPSIPSSGNVTFMQPQSLFLPPPPPSNVTFLRSPPPPPPPPPPLPLLPQSFPSLIFPPMTTSTTPMRFAYARPPLCPPMLPLRARAPPPMFHHPTTSSLPPQMAVTEAMMRFAHHRLPPPPPPMSLRMATTLRFPHAPLPAAQWTLAAAASTSSMMPPSLSAGPSYPFPRPPQQRLQMAATQLGTQQASHTADTEKPEEDKNKAGDKVADDDDLAWAQMEIPAEFGLPTKFFSNKELWEENRFDGASPAGNKRGGGAGRKGAGRGGRRGFDNQRR